ncbi:helix-turn-helix domain-containing protein [Ectobacillus panaciterrae]|uniref:helix-turn-helix domain-containing protein n=1 Tax=Ectobacillus panaciterrae TaxID=363872 RepID=UPI00049130B0|nr:helix-turn-helix transcriptional regulator [Ectobacillus panaciterrae]
MWGLGIGKHSTKLAKFIAKYGYSIQEFSKISKVNRNTLGKLCSDKHYIPSPNTMQKIIRIIRKHEPNSQVTDFWSI